MLSIIKQDIHSFYIARLRKISANQAENEQRSEDNCECAYSMPHIQLIHTVNNAQSDANKQINNQPS